MKWNSDMSEQLKQQEEVKYLNEKLLSEKEDLGKEIDALKAQLRQLNVESLRVSILTYLFPYFLR